MTRNDSRRSQAIPDTSERHEPHIEILKIETIGSKIRYYQFQVCSVFRGADGVYHQEQGTYGLSGRR